MQRLVYNPGPIPNPTATIIVAVLGVSALGLVGYGLYRHFAKPAPSTGPTRVP